MSAIGENLIAKRLLEEAVRLFAHKGYPATSTREIVEAAGVTKPMLYYYFQNKEGLLVAALDHFAEQFQERLVGVINQTSEPYQQLIEITWAQLDFCQRHKPLARLFYTLSFGPDDQKNLVDLERYVQPIHELMSQVIERAIQTGLVYATCQQTFLMGLRGAIHIWVIDALDDRLELTYPLAQQIVDDLLRGFRAVSTNSFRSDGVR